MKKVTRVPANAKIAAGKKFEDLTIIKKTDQGKSKSKPIMKDAKPKIKYPKGM